MSDSTERHITAGHSNFRKQSPDDISETSEVRLSDEHPKLRREISQMCFPGYGVTSFRLSVREHGTTYFRRAPEISEASVPTTFPNSRKAKYLPYFRSYGDKFPAHVPGDTERPTSDIVSENMERNIPDGHPKSRKNVFRQHFRNLGRSSICLTSEATETNFPHMFPVTRRDLLPIQCPKTWNDIFPMGTRNLGRVCSDNISDISEGQVSD
jgi:hypothetical protein